LINIWDKIYDLSNYFLGRYLGQRIILETYVKVLTLIRPWKIEDEKFHLKRVGSINDGGYVIPEYFIKNFKKLYSFGIGNNNDFEFEMARNLNVYQFDHTIESPPKSGKNLFFKKIGLAGKTKTNFTTIDKILENETDLQNVILKLDIEGSEFESLKKSNLWVNVGAIIIEIHGTQSFVLGSKRSQNFKILDKLISNFLCLHTHANNCCGFYEGKNWRIPKVAELTLINKTLIKNFAVIPREESLPTEIDRPNLQSIPDLYLGNMFSSSGIGFG
jgi:FkbM family methyltransferase